MKRSTVLFDLDGTLTDSAEGIINAVIYSLSTYGIQTPRDSLHKFIGPPLHASFMQFFGFTEADALEAVRRFRIYYLDRGWLENAPYPGIADMLQKLQSSGRKLLVATSKPEPQAVNICSHFGLSPYLELVCGSDPDIPSSSIKHCIIENALRRCGLSAGTDVLMVGDRKHDILGAHEAGLQAAGVLWGYGSYPELQKAGADYLSDSPAELAELIINM